MTALDILIHIRDGDPDPLAARTAIAIAQRVPSHLYGLGVAVVYKQAKGAAEKQQSHIICI